MTGSRRTQERRTLIVGAATIVAIVAIGRGVPALRGRLANASASSREVLEEYVRARAQVAALPAVRDSARARQQRLGNDIESLLRGKGVAGVVAALVAEVNDDADASHVTVTSVDGRADTLVAGSYLPVTARAEVLGDVRGIAGLVSMLESSDVRLRVTELSVSQSEPAAPAPQPELLHATVVVQGLARRPMRQLRAVADAAPRQPVGGTDAR